MGGPFALFCWAKLDNRVVLIFLRLLLNLLIEVFLEWLFLLAEKEAGRETGRWMTWRRQRVLSGRRTIGPAALVCVIVKWGMHKKGGPRHTELSSSGADIVTVNHARERALEHRWMAKQGRNPHFGAPREILTFEGFTKEADIERVRTGKNAKR